MIVRSTVLALGAVLLSTIPYTFAFAPSDIPADTPVSQLIASANAHLAQGKAQDALTYFDVAVSRDPTNYLTLFRRGAAYLSLGKTPQAQQDFDRALAIKPGFEGALGQRAKLRARNGDWTAAKDDYRAAGKGSGQEVADLEEAEGAAKLAADAEKRGDWDACVNQAQVAIMVAAASLELRQMRARCRLEKGEVIEGVSDLSHVLKISPALTQPHLQISAMLFYSLGETEKGLKQVKECLHSDPDSKACRRLFRREKSLDKNLSNVKQMIEKRQLAGAVKLLVPTGEDQGLIQNVREDLKEYKDQGIIHKNSPDGLLQSLLEMACEAYYEMNNLNKAAPFCTEALTSNPNALYPLLHKAQTQLAADSFEPAIHTLNHAHEHHPSSPLIQPLLQKAHTLHKRSTSKDYYKVLGLSRDASDKEIKSAYRKLTKQFHPDKAALQGVSKEDAEKKMGTINEAYEVLRDPELKARFDRGDDPNDQSHQGSPFHGSPFQYGAGGQPFFFRSGGSGGGGGGAQFQFKQGGGGFPFGAFNFP